MDIHSDLIHHKQAGDYNTTVSILLLRTSRPGCGRMAYRSPSGSLITVCQCRGCVSGAKCAGSGRHCGGLHHILSPACGQSQLASAGCQPDKSQCGSLNSEATDAREQLPQEKVLRLSRGLRGCLQDSEQRLHPHLELFFSKQAWSWLKDGAQGYLSSRDWTFST